MGPESARSVTAVGMTLFLLRSVGEGSSGNGAMVGLRLRSPLPEAAGYVGAEVSVEPDGHE
jgi:hypothetical protein